MGDRVFGSTMVGAFAEEVVVPAPRRWPGSRRVSRRATPRRSASPTERRITSSARWLGCSPARRLIVLGAGGGVGLAAVQIGAVLGASVTAVASSPEKLDVAKANGADTLDRPQGRRSAKGARATRFPTAPTSSSTRSAANSAEPALRSLRWGGRFVTVGYASGEIPRIPLNLVLLKGVHVLGFQMLDFAANAPEELHRNQQRAAGAARLAAGRAAHRRRLRARRRGRRAALCRGRPRDREGRHRRRVSHRSRLRLGRGTRIR